MSDADDAPIAVPLAYPLKFLRFTLFVHGVILPCIVLGISLSGKDAHEIIPALRSFPLSVFGAHAAMLLRPVAWLPFAPLIIFSMISMATWTVSPAMGERTWVRMGITLGVPLSLQFLLLLLLIFHAPMLFTTLLVWSGWQTGMALLHFVIRRQFSIWHILVLMTLTALLAFVGVRYFGQSDIPRSIELVQKLAYYIPAAGAFAILVAAPGLNFVAYCIAAHAIPWPNSVSPPDELLKQKRWRLGWIIYGVCAWRWAIVKSLEEYSSLSYTVANCYLSNAASHAHPLLTGAARRGAVTMGMRRLKFLENRIESHHAKGASSRKAILRCLVPTNGSILSRQPLFRNLDLPTVATVGNVG